MKDELNDGVLANVNGGLNTWHTHNGADIEEPSRPFGSVTAAFVDSDDFEAKKAYESAYANTDPRARFDG